MLRAKCMVKRAGANANVVGMLKGQRRVQSIMCIVEAEDKVEVAAGAVHAKLFMSKTHRDQCGDIDQIVISMMDTRVSIAQTHQLRVLLDPCTQSSLAKSQRTFTST
jgi:hypothetical protein